MLKSGTQYNKFHRVLVSNFLFESLILAQDERWRRALGMQVERLCVAQEPLTINKKP